MKALSVLLTSLLIAPSQVQAYDEYQPGFSSERKCFKTEYREEYIPGSESSPGYVRYFKDEVSVPCISTNWRTVRRYQNYKPHWNKRTKRGYLIHGNRYSSEPLKRNYGYLVPRQGYAPRKIASSCNSPNKTTGGLIGGGIAAALSKKDAYGWSIPLGAVLGMGLTSADC
ncbi:MULTISPECIES: hypothetical protein [Prochlorococcus]|uniref:hypothetical protein n=1 Tax=Prochlorococcus TaxID=1218 RepID=UPI0005338443|nr:MULTISPECIES: hypothetical protein [Prochlorococcus]KGG12088.1 putative cAMP phosphodiesterases class-II precursor [Prochlorococcus sp. MIT 0601]